jgi:hypothetical protein
MLAFRSSPLSSSPDRCRASPLTSSNNTSVAKPQFGLRFGQAEMLCNFAPGVSVSASGPDLASPLIHSPNDGEHRQIGQARLDVDREQVIHDRRSGLSLSTVDKKQGISRASVCRLMKQACDSTVRLDAQDKAPTPLSELPVMEPAEREVSLGGLCDLSSNNLRIVAPHPNSREELHHEPTRDANLASSP